MKSGPKIAIIALPAKALRPQALDSDQFGSALAIVRLDQTRCPVVLQQCAENFPVLLVAISVHTEQYKQVPEGPGDRTGSGGGNAYGRQNLLAGVECARHARLRTAVEGEDRW